MPVVREGEKSDWVPEGRIIPIDINDVALLLEPWRGERPVTAATFLAGGLMNRNYRVRVGSDDVVLRFYDRDARAWAKEVCLLSQLRGRVAVPEVLYAGTGTEAVPFVVLEFVDGISMRELKRSGDTSGIGEGAYAVGRELATLASVRPRDPTILATHFEPNPELLHGLNVNARLVDHFLESALLRERLGEHDATRVHDFAWCYDDALSAMSESPGIAHGDLNSANIMVRQCGGRWTVAAILDWEFAFEGPIAYDIGNFLRYERASNPRYEPSFSRGLADGGVSLPNGWRQTARAADLSALCELLTRPATPNAVVEEICELVLATIDHRDFMSS